MFHVFSVRVEFDFVYQFFNFILALTSAGHFYNSIHIFLDIYISHHITIYYYHYYIIITIIIIYLSG